MNELQDTIRRLQNKNNSLENDFKQEIVNIQKKYNASKKVHSMMTQTNELELGLSDAILKANKEMEGLKSQIREKDQVISQKNAQVDALNAQIQDGDALKEKLQRKVSKVIGRNEQLIKELNEEQRKTNALVDKIDQINEEKEELESQIQLNKSENTDIQSNHKSTIKELESTRNALNLLEQRVNDQSEEIAQVTNDRDHLLTLVHLQSQALIQTEKLIEERQENEKHEVKHNNNNVYQDSSTNEAEWDFGSLPDDLKSILRGIADNDGFSVDKRVSQMFSVVSRWFANLEVENQHNVNALKEKMAEDKKAINDFASSLLNAIDEDQLDFTEIVAAVENLYKDKLSLQQKVNELQSIPEVCDKATYDEMVSTIENLQEAVSALRNKNKQRKIEIHECKEAFISVKNKSDEELQTMHDANKKARETIDQLQAQLNDLHKQNQDLLDELSDSKQSHLSEYSEAQSEIEAVLMEQSSKYDMLKADLEKEIRDRDAKLLSFQNRAKEYDKSLKKWEEISRQATEETRNFKAQLNKTIMEKDDQFSQMVRQKDREARQIEEKYQEMIEELKTKSSETEEIVASMAKGIEENEAKMRQMTQQISQLNFQLQKSEIKSQSQIDSVERQKKLAIAQLKAQIMAIETKYSVLADEQKHKWEAEKRSLFCYIAQQFGSFYDAKQSLNEDSFKQIVNKIKLEIERHKKQEKTIRKLIKAKESQATEDALADLVLSIHPQLQQKRIGNP